MKCRPAAVSRSVPVPSASQQGFSPAHRDRSQESERPAGNSLNVRFYADGRAPLANLAGCSNTFAVDPEKPDAWSRRLVDSPVKFLRRLRVGWTALGDKHDVGVFRRYVDLEAAGDHRV